MKIFAKILLGTWGILYLPRLLAGGLGSIVRWALVIGLARFTYVLDPSFHSAVIGVMAGLMAPWVIRVYLCTV